MTQLITDESRETDLGQPTESPLNSHDVDSDSLPLKRSVAFPVSGQDVGGSSPREPKRQIVTPAAAIIAGLIVGWLVGTFSALPGAAEASWQYMADPSRGGMTPMFALPLFYGVCGAVVGMIIGALIGYAAFLPRLLQHAGEVRPVSRSYSTSHAKPSVS